MIFIIFRVRLKNILLLKTHQSDNFWSLPLYSIGQLIKKYFI